MWYPEVTQKEKEVIEELKRRTIDDVSPTLLEDKTVFYRFAKARDFDLTAAEAMLRKNIAWRKEFEADTMLTDYKPQEVLEKYVASCIFCFDKEGSPVRYTDFGQIDMKGLLKSCRNQEILKSFAMHMEYDGKVLREQTIKLRKPITKVLHVFNFGNLTLSSATHFETLQTLSVYLKVYVDHLPERLKIAFLINAPIYVSTLLSVFKAVLPPTVIRKVRCYGAKGWREDLLELIDADVLPAFLGGNRTDPDGNPLCKTFIKHGGPVPRSYYLCNQEKRLSSDPEASKLTLFPFTQQVVPIGRVEAGSFLEWEFETKSRDIGFAVYFGESPGSRVEVVPKQRVDTCYEPEKRLFKCERSGTYTLVFDNSYSWFYSKEVYYRAKLTSPIPDEGQDEHFSSSTPISDVRF